MNWWDLTCVCIVAGVIALVIILVTVAGFLITGRNILSLTVRGLLVLPLALLNFAPEIYPGKHAGFVYDTMSGVLPEAWVAQIRTRRAYNLLTTDPEMKRLCKDRTPGDCRNELGSVTERGILRLDDAALIARARFNYALLSQVDTATCATLARSRGSQEAREIIRSFAGSAPTTKWPDVAAVSFEAALAELRNSPPPRTVPREEAVKVLAHVLSSLSRSDILRAGAALRDIQRASDDDACWVSRLLYKRAAQGQAPEAAALARLLVSGVPESGSGSGDREEH